MFPLIACHDEKFMRLLMSSSFSSHDSDVKTTEGKALIHISEVSQVKCVPVLVFPSSPHKERVQLWVSSIPVQSPEIHRLFSNAQ